MFNDVMLEVTDLTKIPLTTSCTTLRWDEHMFLSTTYELTFKSVSQSKVFENEECNKGNSMDHHSLDKSFD
jgi:hypothetical protein